MTMKLAAPPMPDWIAEMLPENTRRYTVAIAEHTMHVMELGAGHPVLMLHGNPTWGFLYRKVAAALAGEPLRIILPDLIGLGFSSKPRNPEVHQLANHARWVGELLQRLQLERFILVVQDWGGPIGLRAMAEHPGKLQGLVLLNTVVGPPTPGFRPTTFHRFSRLPVVSTLAFRVCKFPQIMLHKAQADAGSIRGRVAAAYRYPLRRLSDNAAPLALARMVPDNLQHPSVRELSICREFVHSYGGPCEIVWGNQDPILGRLLNRMRKALPHAHVTETGAGHFIQEEEPDLIAKAVKAIATKSSAEG